MRPKSRYLWSRFFILIVSEERNSEKRKICAERKKINGIT